MKITIKKEDIIEGIQKGYTIIPNKAGAYLRSLWLNAEGNTLSIMATDANIEFTGIYPAQFEKNSLIGVSSRSFVELLRKLSNQEIILEIHEEKSILLVKQGRGEYTLPCSDPMWFQNFSLFPKENIVEWSSDKINEIIDKLYFCISTDESIEGINSLFMRAVDAKHVEVCGLNGHQLAVLRFEHEGLASLVGDTGILIHKRYLQELKKLLKVDTILMGIEENRVHIKTTDEKEHIAFPLNKQNYPNYAHFIEKLDVEDVSCLKVNKRNIIEALDRLSIFNTESNRCAYIYLTENEIKLSVEGYEVGSATEIVEGSYSGSISAIAFPTKNLLEILSKYISEEVEFIFTSVEGPCGIRGKEDVEYTVIIMPMKVADSTHYE
ncbi:MAG: DNA polymerase III subunit beta [Desulfovibrionaceae bacterium]